MYVHADTCIRTCCRHSQRELQLESELNDTKRELTQLKALHSLEEQQMRSTRAEIEKLQSTNTHLLADLDSTKSLRAELKLLQSANAQMRADLDHAKTATREAELLHSTNAQLRAEIEQLKHEQRQELLVEQDYDDAKKNLMRVESELTRLETQHRNLLVSDVELCVHCRHKLMITCIVHVQIMYFTIIAHCIFSDTL